MNKGTLFDNSSRNLKPMKRVILFIFIFAIHISGFAQSLPKNNSSKAIINLEEKITVSDVKIYPNPCKKDKVTVEFNSREIAEIRLTSIIGKEVLLKKYQFSENKKVIVLNDIPNGIYLTQIKTTDGELVVKKLMVTRN